MIATKADLLRGIRGFAEALGGSLTNIGGDCYVAVVDREPRVAIALKESNLKDKLWVGSPPPILSFLAGDIDIPGSGDSSDFSGYRAFIVLTHVPHKTVLVIPIRHVYTDIIRRAEADRKEDLRTEFDIRRVGYKKYVIKTDPLTEDIPIKTIDNLEPIQQIMAIPLAEF
jgi:hypothetical protein